MKVNYTSERISVGEAAEMLSMSKQAVRVLMTLNKLPIGTVSEPVKGRRKTYYIYRNKILDYLNSCKS